MLRRLLHSASYWIALGYILSVVGCSSIEAPKKKSRDSTGANYGSEDSRAPIDDPVMVGGSYLFCVVDEDTIPVNDPNYVSTGCSMVLKDDQDHKKLGISSNIEASLTGYNVFNQHIDTQIENAPDSSKYNWFIRVPVSEYKESKIEGRFYHKPTKYERKNLAFVKGEPRQIAGRAIPLDRPVITTTFGSDFDMHLGDIQDVENAGKSTLQKDCDDDVSGSAWQTIKYSALSTSIRLKVLEPKTLIGITLEGVCGIDLMTNSASVETITGEQAASNTFGVNSQSLIIDTIDTAVFGDQLEFNLVINSTPDKNNYDDYLVRAITIKSNKNIEVVESETSTTKVKTDPNGIATRSNIMTALRNVPDRTNKSSLNFAAYGLGNNVQYYHYKVAAGSGEACSDTTGYSEKVRINDSSVVDISKLSDGKYTICVLGRDEENFWQNALTATRSSFVKDTRAEKPSLGAAPGGTNNVTNVDITVNSSDLVTYRYKLAAGKATICSSADGYSDDTPIGTSIKTSIADITDGDVTVCVIGTDSVGNKIAPTNAASASWIKDTDAPAATITGVTEGAAVTVLNATVGGPGVTKYRFKVGETATTDCSSGDGYTTTQRAVADPITTSIDDFTGSITLCVVGIDKANNQQTAADATKVTFTKAP